MYFCYDLFTTLVKKAPSHRHKQQNMWDLFIYLSLTSLFKPVHDHMEPYTKEETYCRLQTKRAS